MVAIAFIPLQPLAQLWMTRSKKGKTLYINCGILNNRSVTMLTAMKIRIWRMTKHSDFMNSMLNIFRLFLYSELFML